MRKQWRRRNFLKIILPGLMASRRHKKTAIPPIACYLCEYTPSKAGTRLPGLDRTGRLRSAPHGGRLLARRPERFQGETLWPMHPVTGQRPQIRRYRRYGKSMKAPCGYLLPEKYQRSTSALPSGLGSATSPTRQARSPPACSRAHASST